MAAFITFQPKDKVSDSRKTDIQQGFANSAFSFQFEINPCHPQRFPEGKLLSGCFQPVNYEGGSLEHGDAYSIENGELRMEN